MWAKNQRIITAANTLGCKIVGTQLNNIAILILSLGVFVILILILLIVVFFVLCRDDVNGVVVVTGTGRAPHTSCPFTAALLFIVRVAGRRQRRLLGDGADFVMSLPVLVLAKLAAIPGHVTAGACFRAWTATVPAVGSGSGPSECRSGGDSGSRGSCRRCCLKSRVVSISS